MCVRWHGKWVSMMIRRDARLTLRKDVPHMVLAVRGRMCVELERLAHGAAEKVAIVDSDED